MSGTAKFLGPFKIVDELNEEPTRRCEKNVTKNTETLTEEVKNKNVTSVVKNMNTEETKIKKTPKSETVKNNLTQKTETFCEKQLLEDKTCNKVVNDNENPKYREDELTENRCINPKEDTNKNSVEGAKKDDSTHVHSEDEKSVKSCHTKETKQDSINISCEDQTSVKSCHEESGLAASENADNCDKDEEDQEEPRNSHPYSFMIENFELTKEQRTQTKIGLPKSLKETPLRTVSSRIGLLKLLPALNSAKEIALSVHMDNYQFETTIQLLAISTRDADYIIDVEKVNREILLLTEIFINPKIVKIVFSPKKLLTVLQNILHLYLINIFDCERAGKALQTGFTNLEMILLKEYSYEVDPKMKQVDCRSRPFSPQFQEYCRVFPHYLIYMYHDYKNKLLSKDENLYKELMNEFRETSKVIYPNFMQTKLLSLEEELQNHHKCQLEVLEKLNDWRNDTATNLRKLPTTIITQPQLITLSSILPATEFSVCCISKSPFVKDGAEKILGIIKEAKRKYKLERLPISSKRKIEELKEFLLTELDIYTRELDLYTSNLNAAPKTSNEFEKPRDQKIGQVAPTSTSRRNRPGKTRRMALRKAQLLAASQAKSERNSAVNVDFSPGSNYIGQAAPVYYSSQKSNSSKDSSNNGSATGSRSAGTSNSYSDSEIQKRINALKRKLSGMHQRTDEDHNDSRKRRN